jgi:hypothetical protein
VFTLAGGSVVYSTAGALTVVCEYAFATETLEPKSRYQGAFAPRQIPRYAYRPYDCIPASRGRGLTDLDLLITAGRNARIDMRAFARLRSFADRAAADLDAAYSIQANFLKLARNEVGNNPRRGLRAGTCTGPGSKAWLPSRDGHRPRAQDPAPQASQPGAPSG